MYGATRPNVTGAAALRLGLGRHGARVVDADDSAAAVERHDPARGVPVAGWLAQRPVFEERDLPRSGELGLAKAGHGAAAAAGDLAPNEQVGNVREDAERGARVPRLGGQMRAAMRKEDRTPRGRPRTECEIHLRRDAAAVDLRAREAVVRAPEPGPHANNDHGIFLRSPPPLGPS